MISQRQFPVRRRPSGQTRRRQGGQAVLWFLAMLAACCCTFALVYNVGQVANKKEETINAADASALSGSMVEARMLNFEAYTNRALIANEVTIAQMVSLDSWAEYNNEMFQWIATYTAPIPYLDDLTQGLAQVTEAVAEGVDGVVGAAVPGIEGLNRVLVIARDTSYGIGFFAANDIAGQVAGANATVFGGSFDKAPETVDGFKWVVFGANEIAWNNFSSAYSGDDRKNGKQAILNSRDQFTTKRDEGYLIGVINDALEAAGRIATLNQAYIGFDKTSGTTTLQNYDDWAGQDSLDVATYTNDCLIFSCFDKSISPIQPPLAYGRADAEANGTGDDLCYVKPTTTNCTLAVQNSNNISWSGMPNIRDLAQNLSKTDPCSLDNGSDSPSLSFITAVQKSSDSALTTQQMGIGVAGSQSVPQMTDNFANGKNLTSIAAACTFFLRPDLNAQDRTQGSLARSDGVHEFASLYNPYWQARLTTPSATLTTTLYALIGQPALNLALN